MHRFIFSALVNRMLTRDHQNKALPSETDRSDAGRGKAESTVEFECCLCPEIRPDLGFTRAPQAFSSAQTLSAVLWRRWQVEAFAALRRSAWGTAQGLCSHLVLLSLLVAPGGASSLGAAPFCCVSSMYCCTARNTASSTNRLLRFNNSSSSGAGAFLSPTHTEESINTHTHRSEDHTRLPQVTGANEDQLKLFLSLQIFCSSLDWYQQE